MSRQNKNRRVVELRKHFTKLHLAGQKGPSNIQPNHGKRRSRRSK